VPRLESASSSWEGGERPPRCAERTDGRRVARQIGRRSPERSALLRALPRSIARSTCSQRTCLPRVSARAAARTPFRCARRGRCGERLRPALTASSNRLLVATSSTIPDDRPLPLHAFGHRAEHVRPGPGGPCACPRGASDRLSRAARPRAEPRGD
jgi:hypothetical protein